MKVFLDGRLLDARRARVSVFDHGYLYGDGIYETVRAYNYRIFHWPDHDRRLRQSARRLQLACPWSSRYLERAAVRLLRANREPEASVRITVSRGPGPLGLDPRVCPKPTLAMLLHPARPLEKIWRDGVSIGIVRTRRNHPLSLDPQIKANNSLNTILAKMESSKLGVFEAVLLNLDGYLTEGTTSNVFWVKGNRLMTPALSCGLLEGVTRAAVLKLARPLGLTVQEGRFRPSDLRKADEVFLSSTTLEVAPVVRAVHDDGKSPRRWKVGDGRPGPITKALHSRLQAMVRP